MSRDIVDKIQVVGYYQPLDAKGFGQKYEVYSIYAVIGSLIATDYKQPKAILIHVNGKMGLCDGKI